MALDLIKIIDFLPNTQAHLQCDAIGKFARILGNDNGQCRTVLACMLRHNLHTGRVQTLVR